MTTIRRPSKRLLFGSITVVFGIALVVFLTWAFLPSYSQDPSGSSGSSATFVVDPRDDRKLVGFADFVFFAQVLEALGQTEDRGYRQTLYSVKALEALKGTVNGTVTVRQHGRVGGDDRGRKLARSDRLLEPGKSYLFVTLDRRETGQHTLFPVYGNIEIRIPKHASDEAVLGSQHATELRARFTDAVEREVPYDPNSP